MTRDEIIRIAQEAGFRAGHITLLSGDPIAFVAPISATSCIVEVERFAALIAEAEREAIVVKLLELGALGDGAYIEAIYERGNQPPRVGDCTEVKPS